jgi:5-formyltetrahydrofolate cyclo-ligase
LNPSKTTLRTQINQKLKELTPTQKLEFSLKANEHLLEFTHSRRLKNICLTSSLPDELSTQNFLDKHFHDFHFYLPKVNVEKNELSIHLIADIKKDLQLGTLNILEPITAEELNWQKKVDCIVVPARALDIEGNRLGRGKGYYDRLLMKVDMQKTVVVCMIFHCQLLAEVPTETFDVPIEYCITEKGVFHLRRKSI